MNDLTIRRITADEAPQLLAADELIWAAEEDAPLQARLADTPTRAGFIVERGEEVAGIFGSWDIELAVPDGAGGGRLVPVEGLTWVGVHPDHRRQGVLREMMRHHLRWTRDQGRAIAALKASEPGIYGRFGYGLASQVLKAKFGRGCEFSAPPAVSEAAQAVRTTFATAAPDDAPRLHALARRCAAVGAGSVVRSAEDLRRICTDVLEHRRGRERNRLLWATRDGSDVGYAFLRRTHKWPDGLPAGEVDVFMIGAVDAATTLALVRRLVDFDLMASTVSWVALDDPTVLWSPSARSLGTGGVTDALWLRLVDLPAAAAGRGYASDVDVRIAVRDELIPENDRTWHWLADGGEGRVEASDQDPDLTVDIADLAAVWVGGQTLGARAAAGFVEEHRPGAVAELDAALRTPTQPTKAVDF